MASLTRTPRPKTREEDYRDYNERDISEGWPYADEEVVAKKNEAYGVEFDDEDKTSVEISDEPAIESQGGPNLFPETAKAAVEDDGVEETIYERLTNTRRWEDNQLTVTMHDGVATLDGKVETERDRQLINQIALGTPGVEDTINRITLIGVDSHIPRDAD
ncbi:BON domain-containing protein [Rhizobium sp. TRM95796]|uniref:BON domain-containing protein n=1 Tax=Rhizobium sp. TRM95796 TaxID=2979862 RepID=UPI0021E8AB3B|nr:BON domain-containing protein [Rhizobium sp. TRM95796]MCV3764961.1 BON domain-containing protein [Rhizobium sp. TRM95796]